MRLNKEWNEAAGDERNWGIPAITQHMPFPLSKDASPSNIEWREKQIEYIIHNTELGLIEHVDAILINPSRPFWYYPESYKRINHIFPSTWPHPVVHVTKFILKW